MHTATFATALAALLVGCACFPAGDDKNTPAHTPSHTAAAALPGASAEPSAAASHDKIHGQHKRSIDNLAPALGDENQSPFDQVSQLERRIKVLPAYLG